MRLWCQVFCSTSLLFFSATTWATDLCLETTKELLALYQSGGGTAQDKVGITQIDNRCDLVILSKQIIQLGLKEKGGEVEVVLIGNADPIVIESDRRLNIESYGWTSDNQLMRVEWAISNSNSNASRKVLWFDVKRKQWAWRSARDLAPGTQIDTDDVVRVYGLVAGADYFSDEVWPGGHRVGSSAIGAGQVLQKDRLVRQPDLEWGDPVVVQIKKGAILLELAGELQAPGYLDQVARLKLRHNGEIAYGRLHANGIVVPCGSSLYHRSACVD